MSDKPNHLLAAVNLAAEARDLIDRHEGRLGTTPKHIVDAVERLADAVRHLAAEVEAQSKVACPACPKNDHPLYKAAHTCAKASP